MRPRNEIYRPDLKITELKSSDIPEGTTEIDLSESPNLNKLPDDLPATIKSIILFRCIKLEKLPATLPEGLESIDLSTCPILNELPDSLPKSLTELYLLECSSLPKLPNSLPKSLTKLDLYRCIRLTELPDNLPANLINLDLSECSKLTKLPAKLPNTLKELNLSRCTSLTELPDSLPEGLEYLQLSGCTSLPNNRETINKLLKLEERNRINGNTNFCLIWPEHLDKGPEINEIKDNLKAAYKEFYATDENFKNREATPNHQFPTYFLIHRFVNESVGQRGGTQLIAESALKVSKVIKDNPSLLETLDESAKNFLDACVNQPVAGFSEIAVLAEIALQPEIPAKLEKAKILIAEELIKEEVRALGASAGLEVELGNAMLREVHKNLLANHKITEPWPGIPEGVAYEASVRSHTTEENITKISKKVSEKLDSLTQENVSEFLLEGRFQDFWASANVAKEKRDELKSPYSKAVEELLEKPISQEELKKLETNCREKILEESRKITQAAISPSITSSHEEATGSGWGLEERAGSPTRARANRLKDPEQAMGK